MTNCHAKDIPYRFDFSKYSKVQMPILLKNRTKRLVIFVGLLGDFDSIEYIQLIVPILPKLKKACISLCIIAIGNEESKNRFCNYTGIPKEHLYVFPNNVIHNSFGLDKGLEFFSLTYLNLLLMCAGLGSKGTIKEVVRGYIGDPKSSQIFRNDVVIRLGKLPSFSASIFKAAGGEGFQRPFELATHRLANMIEVISNWKLYMLNGLYLTQRGGTFLISENDNFLYSYYSKSLLSYSETMRQPLRFLENWVPDLTK